METTEITRRIGLIGCSSSKNAAAKADHDLLIPAKDMYIGDNFLKSREEGLEYFGCDDYYILSGEYGLLDKNDMIHYYNRYLHNETPEYKKAWRKKVCKQLQEKFGDDLQNIEFIFFCGLDYTITLKTILNCKILKNVAHKITFDVVEKRRLIGRKSKEIKKA